MAWTFEHRWKLAASADAAFRALTEPTQLRQWFAEHVDVGGAVGEPFRFWGKHSLDTPSAAMATQRLTHWEPGRQLGFTWTIGGVDTTVLLTIEPAETSCHLQVHHAVIGELPFPRERELIDDHWRFVTGNLMQQLAGGAGIVLPDFSDPSPVVRQVLLIDAPRDVVFATLITPELVNQWFGTTVAEIEPRVGGRYSVGWKYQIDGRDVVGGPTQILEFVQNERLTLDWPDWRGDASVTGQTISFVLESVGAQTQLTFLHAGFTRTADISDFPFGWVWFLGELRRVATARR